VCIRSATASSRPARTSLRRGRFHLVTERRPRISSTLARLVLGQIDPGIPVLFRLRGAIRKDRQSGFLPPQFGTSARRDLRRDPVLLAISDSQDATAPSIPTRSAFRRQLEYRYVISRTSAASSTGSSSTRSSEGELRGSRQSSTTGRSRRGSRSAATLNACPTTSCCGLRDLLQTRSAQRAESICFSPRRGRTGTSWVASTGIRTDDARPIELQRVPELTLSRRPTNLRGCRGSLSGGYTSLVEFLPLVGSEEPFSTSSVVRGQSRSGLRDRHALRGWAHHRLQHDGHRVHAPVAGARDRAPTASRASGSCLEYEPTPESRASRVSKVGGWNVWTGPAHA